MHRSPCQTIVRLGFTCNLGKRAKNQSARQRSGAPTALAL